MDNSAFSLTDNYSVDPSNYEMPDFYEFYNDYGRSHSSSGWIDTNPYDIWGNIDEFFTGNRSSALEEYNRQKELKEKAFEEARLASARDFQNYMESTKYQRTKEDLQKAGFNPYMMIQQGLGTSNVSPGPTSNRASARYLNDRKKGDRSFGDHVSAFATTALRVLALLAMA